MKFFEKLCCQVLVIALLCFICDAANATPDTVVHKRVLVDIDSINQEVADTIESIQKSSANETKNNVKMIWLFFASPFLLVFCFCIFIWYRKKREHEFLKHVSEIEMKALRAQINPHFIFNCINSVNNFMQKNNVAMASDYLITFAKLIRMVLENSEHREIALRKDLEALELYMQLEQVRIASGFNYKIITDAAIDLESAYVPPMLLQPFVENCIWHGLNSKTTKGMIIITVVPDNKMLKFTIEDDGNEVLVKDHSDIYKKKSMGISLINDRLAVLNKLKNSNAHFNISDIRNAENEYLGKRVKLWLPFE